MTKSDISPTGLSGVRGKVGRTFPDRAGVLTSNGDSLSRSGFAV